MTIINSNNPPQASGEPKGMWQDGWKDKILDMNTSDREIYDLAESVFTSQDSKPGEQNLFATLLSQRQQKVTLMSNLMRMIFDGANQIIRNIRA